MAPLLEVIGSARSRDRGPDANPSDSGYNRLPAAPALDASVAGMRLTFTADIPVHEHFNGNQLAAPALFKLVVGHAF